jgi:redox-sensing transcriptional repressor
MPRYANVPGPTIRRLSLYLRQLEAVQSRGQTTVSSKQLGEPLRVTDAQVRKDLAYFGQFGRPGIGYRVADLIAQARRILGTDRPWRSILVGAGNLGRALISYRGFAPKGFNIVAVFDGDEALVGQTIRTPDGLTVLPMFKLPEVVRKERTRIGILAVPAGAAQSVADLMLQAGVQGLLNFAPVALRVPPTVPVASVDLTINLEQLSFQIRELVD